MSGSAPTPPAAPAASPATSTSLPGPFACLRRSTAAALTQGWPILQKEIRADFRKNRFFVTHLVCLAILAAGILFMVVNGAESKDVKPEVLGWGLFNTFFKIQFLVVLVVFPAFSANALSEERAAGTFDLLLTTSLRPAEVVWGKFLACSIYCLVYIVATIPLLALSLLFAGVSLTEILLAYGFLIGLTAVLSMAGVFISSCFASNVRATFVTYVLSFGLLTLTVLALKDVIGEDKGTLVKAILGKVGGARAAALEPVALLESGIPILAYGCLAFAYFFLLAANRLRPRNDDRSSALRLLTAVAITGWMVTAVATGPKVMSEFTSLMMAAAAVLLVAGVVFASESADLPSRLRRRFARLRGMRAPLRIFAQGPFTGLLFTAALTGIVVESLIVIGGRFPFGPTSLRWGEVVATLPPYVLAFAALSFWLSSAGFTPAYTRLTVVFVFIITLLLPVIFEVSERGDGVLTLYYLSPVTICNSLDPTAQRPEGPHYVVLGVPVARVAQVLFTSIAILLTGLGLVRCRRRGWPVLSYREPAPPAAAEPSAESPDAKVPASVAAPAAPSASPGSSSLG